VVTQPDAGIGWERVELLHSGHARWSGSEVYSNIEAGRLSQSYSSPAGNVWTRIRQQLETAAGDLENVCLRRKLYVQLNAKIADRLHWLMEPTVRFSSLSGTLPKIFLEPNHMSSVSVLLSCSRHEEHHGHGIQLCSVTRAVGTSETGVST